MNDTALPRVTYSNIGADFAPLHAHLDEQIPAFEREQLGQAWSTPFATGPAQTLTSPIDPGLTLGHFLAQAQAGVLYANRASGATTGAWPGAQPFCGWKGTGVGGKGGLGSHYLLQFLREQSQTIMRS